MSDCTEIWILNYWLAIQILYSSPHWTQSSGYMGGVFVYTCRSSSSVKLIISHFHTVFSLFVEMTTIPVKTHNWSFTLNKDNWFFFYFQESFKILNVYDVIQLRMVFFSIFRRVDTNIVSRISIPGEFRELDPRRNLSAPGRRLVQGSVTWQSCDFRKKNYFRST